MFILAEKIIDCKAMISIGDISMEQEDSTGLQPESTSNLQTARSGTSNVELVVAHDGETQSTYSIASIEKELHSIIILYIICVVHKFN